MPNTHEPHRCCKSNPRILATPAALRSTALSGRASTACTHRKLTAAMNAVSAGNRMSGSSEARRQAVAQNFPQDPRRVLTRQQAREVYNRAGSQVRDSESSYGSPAISTLLSAVDLTSTTSVLELGCGPGRLAALLLQQHLPGTCTYTALDPSPVMAGVAQERLASFGARASVMACSGDPQEALSVVEDCSVDVFLTTYVLDILSDDDVCAVLVEAWRVLRPGGKLCVVNLGHGSTLVTKIGSWAWQLVHYLAPEVVGGCRAQDLVPYLGPGWKLAFNTSVPGRYVCSQVLVCQRT